MPTAYLYDLTDTWNNGATDFDGFRLSVTDTASGANSNLFQLRGGAAGTTALFSVGKNGSFGRPAVATFLPSTSLYFDVLFSGVARSRISTGFECNSAGAIAWSSTGSPGSPDVTLLRDAADRLALRRLANSQAFRVYNTTDAGLTNFERGVFGWVSNVLQIGTENGGTGLARSVDILTGGVVRLSISSTSIASAAQNFLVPAGNIFVVTGRAQYRATADGVLVFSSSAGNDINRICWGDSTVAHPALKRSGALLQVRLGDDSAFANFEVRSLSTNFATFLVEAAVALTNSAGANTATLTNAPVTGNPTKWIAINDAGVTRYIPVW